MSPTMTNKVSCLNKSLLKIIIVRTNYINQGTRCQLNITKIRENNKDKNKCYSHQDANRWMNKQCA